MPSLLACCQPLLPVIMNFIHNNITVDDATVSMLLSTLDAFEQQALQSGHSTQTVTQAKYALVALLDEWICSKETATAHGSAKSLQLLCFQSNIAGHQFFDDLDVALQTKHPSLLSIYAFCLSLGFVGKYHDNPDKLNTYKDRLKIVFKQTPKTIPASVSHQSMKVWQCLVAGLGLFLAGYFGLIIALSFKAQSVNQVIQLDRGALQYDQAA